MSKNNPLIVVILLRDCFFEWNGVNTLDTKKLSSALIISYELPLSGEYSNPVVLTFKNLNIDNFAVL